MRKINLLVVHCSGSDLKEDDSIERIKHLHTSPKNIPMKWGKYETNGFSWNDIGYHFVITKDGVIHIGRPIEEIGAHVKGFNASSVGICLTGESDFSEAQFKALRKLVNDLISNLGLSIIDVLGHYELTRGKTCPNFNVQKVLHNE